MSSSLMMFGPPYRFCKILISRLIFFFFTGFSTLTMHFSPRSAFTPSNTSLYFPRPTLRMTS